MRLCSSEIRDRLGERLDTSRSDDAEQVEGVRDLTENLNVY